jgi:hypothetical protein
VSKSSTKRFIIFAGIGAVVAIIIVVAPMLFEEYAASKIRDRANAAGVEVSWGELELQWTGKAMLEDVEVAMPSRGIEATSNSVTIHVDPGSVVGGQPKLSGIGAIGTVVNWDPGAQPQDGDTGSSQSTSGDGLSQAIEELDFLNITDTTVVIGSGEDAIEIVVNSVSVDDGYVQGRARWQAMSLPGGLSMREQDCSFRGEWPGGLAPLELEVSAANNEPILVVSRANQARLEVREMTARLEPENRYARLDLRSIEASLGDENQPLAAVEAPVATFAISPGSRPAAAVLSPKATVDPARWSSVRTAEAGSAKTTPDNGSGTTATAVLTALQDLHLDVEDGTVEFVLGNKRLEIIRELGVVFDGLEVAARGKSAGGSFEMSLGFGATSLVPESVQATFEGVRLGAIPGMNEGRTLPKRGFRGRLDGLVDASVSVVRENDGGMMSATSVSMDAEWRDGTIDVAGLAPEPLEGISASFSFDSDIRPRFGSVDVKNGRATYGPLVVEFDGGVTDWPLDTEFAVDARVQKIACQKAVRSLPDTILGPYKGIAIEGEAGPRFTATLPWHEPEDLVISMDGFVDKCTVTALNAEKSGWPNLTFDKRPPGEREPNPSVKLPVLPPGREPSNLDDVYWMNRPFIMRVTEGVSEDADVYVGPGLESYVPLHELPEYVGAAAYLSEEINFYENHAVDLGHIQKALRMNFEGGEFVYGGSTVDQQLIKNLFLSRDKTLARKLQEALIAWRTEEVVSKDRILELYLNCIEYGDDLYGIGPAAKYYFGKDARELTPEEATLLAIIKPAPWYGERFKRKGTTPTQHWWFDRMGEIMGRLVEKEFITAAEAQMAEPYVLQWDEEGVYLPQEDSQEEEDSGTWDLLDMDGDEDDATQDGGSP